jgi:hypothetical protein
MDNRALVLGLFALLVQLSPGTPTPVAAQAGGTANVFLALLEVYPDVDGRVLLLREPGREIVVLAPAATAADLSVALSMLRRFRQDRETPQPGRGHMIPIVGYAPEPTLTDEERSRLEANLAALRDRPLANVGNLGRGRWMRFGER